MLQSWVNAVCLFCLAFLYTWFSFFEPLLERLCSNQILLLFFIFLFWRTLIFLKAKVISTENCGTVASLTANNLSFHFTFDFRVGLCWVRIRFFAEHLFWCCCGASCVPLFLFAKDKDTTATHSLHARPTAF